MFRIDLFGFWLHRPGEELISIDAGGAFTIVEHFEVGVSRQRFATMRFAPYGLGIGGGQGLVPVLVWPALDFGDIPVYLRYQFLETEAVDISVDLVGTIPINTHFKALVGLPVRFHFGWAVALDTGVEASLHLLPTGSYPFAPVAAHFPFATSSGPAFDLRIPLALTFNPSRHFYIGFDSGFGITDFDSRYIYVPLGAHAGVTIADMGEARVDIEADFGLPRFYGSTGGGFGLDYTTWQSSLGAKVYF